MHGGVQPAAGAAALVHEIEHEEGILHHHDEDGTVHYDASDASLAHVQDHSSCAQPAGFGLARLMLPSDKARSAPGLYVAQVVPEPFLDGPHRPPASSPGYAAGGTLHA